MAPREQSLWLELAPGMLGWTLTLSNRRSSAAPAIRRQCGASFEPQIGLTALILPYGTLGASAALWGLSCSQPGTFWMRSATAESVSQVTAQRLAERASR